jgi:hypothetical protein
MKRFILSTLVGLGLVPGAFAAGTNYVENFEGINSLSYSGTTGTARSASLGAGTLVYANSDRTGAVNIYSNSSPNWKALRLIQDETSSTTGTYTISAGTRVNVFTASFDVLFKNNGGIADRFSFNFGKQNNTNSPSLGESGLWESGQTGSMLSVVWDWFSNGGGDFIGSGANPGGVQVFKNGTEVSGSRINNPISVATNLSGSFTRVNIQYFEELDGGTLTLNTGGTVSDHSISGGTTMLTLRNLAVNFQDGDMFAFSGTTGADSLDVFIDNVNINTIPEPSAVSLLALGLGGLVALRRTRRSAV